MKFDFSEITNGVWLELRLGNIIVDPKYCAHTATAKEYGPEKYKIILNEPLPILYDRNTISESAGTYRIESYRNGICYVCRMEIDNRGE